MNWMLFCVRISLLLISELGVVVYFLLNEWERRLIDLDVVVCVCVCGVCAVVSTLASGSRR